jgi:hypothetical protein
VNIYCTKRNENMVLFKQSVKDVKGSLKEILKDHSKANHNNESE